MWSQVGRKIMTINDKNSHKALRVTDEVRLVKEEVLSILAGRLGCSVEDLTFLFGVNSSIDGLKIPEQRRS